VSGNETANRGRRIAPRFGRGEQFEALIRRSGGTPPVDDGRTAGAEKFSGRRRQTVRNAEPRRSLIRRREERTRRSVSGSMQMRVVAQVQKTVAEEQQPEQKRQISAAAEFCQNGNHLKNISFPDRIVKPKIWDDRPATGDNRDFLPDRY